jgi:hypothetical protein
VSNLISDQERDRRERQRAASIAQNRSYTIAEWCELRRISRGMFYKLKKVKKAPRLHGAGVKQLISPEADADWLREREAEAQGTAA